MIFAHIVDDFYLQGILIKMKQKQWWEENAPNTLYKHDYIIALIIHAISWSCMIMAPAILFKLPTIKLGMIIILFIFNVITHANIDNQKANMHKINLIQDQLMHLGQIIWTWIGLVVL
jgi:hypothetical protein